MLEGMDCGVDLFDSSYALHCSELGCALQTGSMSKVNYRDSVWALDGSLGLSEDCDCPCCSYYSKAYVHHLLNTNEMLGKILLQTHNVHVMLAWFSDARAAISAGPLRWAAFKAQFRTAA